MCLLVWCVAEEEEAEEQGCGLTQPLQSGHQCKSHTLSSDDLLWTFASGWHTTCEFCGICWIHLNTILKRQIKKICL